MEVLQRVLEIGQRAPLPLVVSFLLTTVVGFALLVNHLLPNRPVIKTDPLLALCRSFHRRANPSGIITHGENLSVRRLGREGVSWSAAPLLERRIWRS